MAAEAERYTNEELAERLQAAGEGTPEAVDIITELWERNRGLVRQTVHGLTGLAEYEGGFEDMQQQAYFGFHAAAYSYSPEAGIKFSTYATNRIKWELCRYYENNGHTVRIPSHMKQRLRDCMGVKRQLEAEKGHTITYEAALETMGLSPAAISGAMATFRKLETVSIDSPRMDNNDGDGATLLDLLSDGTDVEETALQQEWQRELHELLFAALLDIPADIRAAIVRRYFNGISVSRIANEYGITRQTLYDRERKAFRSIRAGKYGERLAEFMPSISRKERAERLIQTSREATERLRLTETEKGLLIL